jgi:hypothetical protein
MNALSKIITAVLDVLLVPFGDTRHTLGLVWISLFTGAAMALVFKLASDGRDVRKAKDRFASYILEMRLYQDDLGTVFVAFFKSLWSNILYLRSILKPLLIIIVPVTIVFLQLDERYGRSHLPVGSTTLVTVRLTEGLDPFAADAALSVESGAAVEARPVRIRETREITWRLRIDSTGTHRAALAMGEFAYSVPIIAEPAHRMIGHARSRTPFFEPLLHPALPAIPRGSPLESVRIQYSRASYPLLFWDVHWIVIFIVYSTIAALAVKLVVGFEI